MFGKLWDTPLNGVEALLFEGLINLTNITIFFSDAKNNVYTITLNTGNPYRVVDQVNLPHFVDLRDTFAQSNTEPRTFKMWNSPFKTEINTSTLLFMDVEEEDQFSFGIFAANACIEFIASPPEITVHTNITASKVIEAFFEESIQLMTLDQN